MNKEEIKVGSLVYAYRTRLHYGVGIVVGNEVRSQTVFFTVFWTGLTKTYAGYYADQLELIP